MSLAQITFSLKLDRAYEHGIAFASGSDVLIPIRERGDIRPTETGEVMIHVADHWISARAEQIKFCRRH